MLYTPLRCVYEMVGGSEIEDLEVDAMADVVTIDGGEEEEEEDHQTGSVVAIDGGEIDLVVAGVTVGLTVTSVMGDLKVAGGRGEMKDHVAEVGEDDLQVDGAVDPPETHGEGEAPAIPGEEGVTILLSHPQGHRVGVVVLRITGGGVGLALGVGGNEMSRHGKASGQPQTLAAGGQSRVNESEVGVLHVQVAAGVDLPRDQDVITEGVEAGGVGRRSP